MGRHSAPDEDEVGAATQTASGAVAVGEDARDSAASGRHSSPPDDDEPAEESADESGPDTGGLDLIEEALSGPDSGPMPIADESRRPAPGQPDARPSAPAERPDALHDAPTQRIPTIGSGPDPALEQTDRIPTVSGAGGDTGAGGDAADAEVSEVGVDSAGPVVATTDSAAAGSAARASAPRRGTVGDVALIRRHADVRARVMAAVVVPFLLFFGVFAVAGELTVRRLIWIWVPAVTAGVLVGLLLDAGHRRYPDTGSAPATEPADPSTEPRTR